MRSILTSILLVIAAASWAACVAAAYDWPLQFAAAVADSVDTGVDRLTGNARYYDEVLNTTEKNDFRSVDSVSHLAQKIAHELNFRPRDSVSTQTLDLSGSMLHTIPLLPTLSAGLQWNPLFYLRHKSNGDNGLFQSVLDIGPVLSARPYSLPLSVSGGLAVEGRSDSMYRDLSESHWSDVHGFPGYWVGAAVGSPVEKLFGLPLYLSASGEGRETKQTASASAAGSALYAARLSSGDSLFALYADTVENGTPPTLSESSQGNLYYNPNTPRQYSRSLQASVGFKGAVRVHLIPAVAYSFGRSLTVYPSDAAGLNDRRNTQNNASVTLETDSSLFFYYRGGLRFGFENEDKLFDAHSIDSQTEFNHDSLVRESESYTGNSALMDHSIELPFPNGWRLKYDFSIGRQSITTPVLIAKVGGSGYDTTATWNDNDRIVTSHNVELSTDPAKKLAGSLGGRYAEQSLNYLSGHKSKNNNLVQDYEGQGNVVWALGEAIQFSELATVSARVTSFPYDRRPYVPDPDQPPYSRRAVSVLSGEWQMQPHYRLKARWTETYWDQGLWYGQQYFPADSDTGVVRPDHYNYYAIQTYSLEWEIILALSATLFDTWKAEAGAKLGDVNQRVYTKDATSAKGAGLYEVSPTDVGFDIEPWLRIGWTSTNGRFGFAAYVKRIFRTGDQSRWDKVKNWEINLGGNLGL